MSPLSSEQIDKLRKDILLNVKIRNQALKFKTTWGLFSPRNIDEGSELLLNNIQVNKNDNILDLGCGYGPIGLTLAKIACNGETLLVDKDFKAVEYTQKNILLNQIDNASALLSNGFDQVGHKRFHLIVSNIPAKVGNEMLWLFLHDAYMSLEEGGRLVVVTISGLSKFMKREFKAQFGNYKKLKQGKTYTVAEAIKSQTQ